MKTVAYAFIASMLVCSLASPAMAASRAGVNKAKAAIEASCKKEAAEKKFGVHLIKKRAFMKECRARKV